MNDAAMHAYFDECLAETERLLTDNDQRGFYKHLKGTVGLDGRKATSEQFIWDEDGTLLRDKVRIFKRWARLFGIFITKSSKIDQTISALFPQLPLSLSPVDEPTMEDMTAVFRGMPNWKAVGPDSLPAELQRMDYPEFIRYFHNLLINVLRMGDVLQHWKMRLLRSFKTRRIAPIATITEVFRLLPR
ncbi:MAG: hypothetical protein ABJO54_04965 [Hyphomicrobiales bacterium]